MKHTTGNFWGLVLSMALVVMLCSCKDSEKFKTITPHEAAEMMATGSGYVVVDVRGKEEYDKGHIPGAINVPIDSLKQDIHNNEAIPELADKKKVYLIYCRSGRRSNEAAKLLSGFGYKHIYEFGGIIDWKGEIEASKPAGE